jgi:hypothetical protein
MFIPGVQPGGSDNWANFIDSFSGSVLLAAERATITDMLPIAMKQTFGPNMRADQFIVTGRRTAVYQARGNSIEFEEPSSGDKYLQNLPQTQVFVYLDRPLVAPWFEDEFDKYQTHWAAEQAHAEASGDAIGRQIDKLNLQLILRAAFRTDGGSGVNKTYISGTKEQSTYLEAGIYANFASLGTTAQHVIDTERAFDNMRVAFIKNHYPWERKRKFCFLYPEDYAWITSNLAEYVENDKTPGNGSMATGEIKRLKGWELYEITNMPAGVIGELPDFAGRNSGATNAYKHNATNVRAIFCGEDVIGREHWGPTGMVSRYEKRDTRWGEFYLPAYVGGAVELRPEWCGAIASSAVANRNT